MRGPSYEKTAASSMLEAVRVGARVYGVLGVPLVEPQPGELVVWWTEISDSWSDGEARRVVPIEDGSYVFATEDRRFTAAVFERGMR